MPAYYFTAVTPPTTYPITRDEAKKHLGIAEGETTWNAKIDSLIAAATRYFQEQTRAQLITSIDDLYLDCFPQYGAPIWIPRWPLSSVGSVKYQDTDDNQQTYAASNYVSSPSIPPRISLAYDEADWPATLDEGDAIVIRLTTGYGAASAVPDDIKFCLLAFVHEWFDRREATVMGMNQKPSDLGALAIMQSYNPGDAFMSYEPI